MSAPSTSPPPGRPARLPSIRRRMLLMQVAVALSWGLAVSLVVWVALAHEVDELLDDTLRESAEVLAALVEPGLAARAAPAETPPSPGGHFAWQLVGPEGRVQLRSRRAPERPFVPLPVTGFADAAEWRVYGQRIERGEHLLYVAQTREERREAQMEVALASVLAALVVGLVGAGWLGTRVEQELEPLARSTRALQGYSPLADSAGLPAATRAELAPMHAAIEDLGHRLAERVASERAVSAHAAHALRTPLAGIDAQLAVAMREAPPELVPRLARVRQANERLARVVAALLALFRSGEGVQRRSVELQALLVRLPVAGLAVHAQPGATVDADPDLLTAALSNLLDNAVRHGATTVDVGVRADPGGPVLVVHDDGRGLQEPERARLQQALQTQRYEGATGLGLMLADMVARAHGGALRLPPAERGCRVEMQLPLPV